MKKVLIAAGGTGGHIFPALAIADELSLHDVEVIWLGSEKGLEQKIIVGRYPLVSLSVEGIRGKSVLTKVAAMWRLLKALVQAIIVVQKQKPDLVLGMGGFVSGPAGVAAWLCRVPLMIHEQNSVPGYTNRWLSHVAKRVFSAFPNVFASSMKMSMVGNPVRAELITVPSPVVRYAGRQQPFRLLVLGGSRGARAINQFIMNLLTEGDDLKIKIWHQTGLSDYEKISEQYASMGVDIKVEPFIADMAAAYSWADLVVARAGALTVAEISAVGVASLLIPFPYAVDDHQYHNAMWLAANKAARVMRESELGNGVFTNTILELINNKNELLAMAKQAKSQAFLTATKQVTDACLNAMGVVLHTEQRLDFGQVKKVYCIGVGGIGVSALARYFRYKGCEVSGSDTQGSPITDDLQKIGVTVYFEHAADQVGDCDLVIYSSAIDAANEELIIAGKKGIPVVKRGVCLAEILKSYQTIAVAGTHGKTTTTSLVAWLLHQQGVDINYIIGGTLQGSLSPLYLGNSEYFVVESDESDASFLELQPNIAVVTNIDNDHLQTYGGELRQLKEAFIKFLNRLPKEGVAIICIDDKNLQDIVAQLTCRVLTVGFHATADIRAFDYQQCGLQTSFQIDFAGQKTIPLKLNLAGKHNVTNALAAIGVLQSLNCMDAEKLAVSGLNFPGVNRRLQLQATLPMSSGEVLFLEDYGHHPVAVHATMRAIRAAWPERRLIMVFQPHRYTRTVQLQHEFVEVLSQVDVLLLLDVYAAGEEASLDHPASDLKIAVSQVLPSVYFMEDVAALSKQIAALIRPHDVIVFQGAGSVGAMLKEVVAELQAEVIM